MILGCLDMIIVLIVVVVGQIFHQLHQTMWQVICNNIRELKYNLHAFYIIFDRASSKQLVTLVSWSLFSFIYIYIYIYIYIFIYLYIYINNKSFSYIYRNMRVILFIPCCLFLLFGPERDRPVNTALLLQTFKLRNSLPSSLRTILPQMLAA